MKKFVVLSLSLLAVFYCSCNQKEECQCRSLISWADCTTSIDVKIPKKPVFKNGVFHVDLEIESDVEGDAFILLQLVNLTNRSKYLHITENEFFLYVTEDERITFCDVSHPNYGVVIDGEIGPVFGYGSDVKVDGYQVRTFQQVFALRVNSSILYFDCYNDNGCVPVYANDHDVNDKPTMQYPTFVKKIKLPQKATFHEKINIRLPKGYNDCWGEILVVRSNKAIEESMKTKLDPERDKDNGVSGIYYDNYHHFFPDSSLFSYLIADLDILKSHYMEYVGYKDVSWECCKGPTLPMVGYSSVATFGEIISHETIPIEGNEHLYKVKPKLVPYRPTILNYYIYSPISK